MSGVRRSPPPGQGSPASSASSPPVPVTVRLDWGDPAAVDAWLRDVHTQASDAVEAGKDATRPPAQRELGRRAARRIILQASRKLAELFRMTEPHPGEKTPPAAEGAP